MVDRGFKFSTTPTSTSSKPGDVVSVELPSGRVESLRILAITAPVVAEAA